LLHENKSITTKQSHTASTYNTINKNLPPLQVQARQKDVFDETLGLAWLLHPLLVNMAVTAGKVGKLLYHAHKSWLNLVAL
jgi:hypothetical protein